MKQDKKDFKAFIESVQRHLDEGTIYGEGFNKQLKKAKQEAGIKTEKDESYPEPSLGHVLQ